MNLRVGAGVGLLRLLGATWSTEFDGVSHLEAARRASPRGNVIFAIWHCSLLMLASTHRHRDVHVLVSQHRDGEWIGRILEKFGFGLVRGSSRRGGVEALFQLATLLEAGRDVALTVDGPVGPRYSVHPGVALLARRTKRPIVPVVATFGRGCFLPTWDALRLPAPGTRLYVAYEAAITVPEPLPPEGILGVQAELEARLRRATTAAEARFGRRIELQDIQDRRSYWERVSEQPSPGLGLRFLSRVYGAAAAAERRLRPRPAGLGTRPWVVGIGNLEAGGTGKTPVVIALANACIERGARVTVLTRGHGGGLGSEPVFVTASDLGRASDETRVLVAALGARASVVVGRQKQRALETIRERGGCDLVLVDDAFQTAGLEVDRHLLVLDAKLPFGNGFLLPAGRLREPARAVRRAAAFLFTRAPLGWQRQPLAGFEDLNVPQFVAYEHFAAFRTPLGVEVPVSDLQGAGVVLLCGLGRPGAFEALAQRVALRAGFRVCRAVRVGDHAPIEAELRRLAGRLTALECSHILISAKDLARLPPGSKWNEPLLVLEQRLEIPELQRLVACLMPPQFASAKLANDTESDVWT